MRDARANKSHRVARLTLLKRFSEAGARASDCARQRRQTNTSAFRTALARSVLPPRNERCLKTRRRATIAAVVEPAAREQARRTRAKSIIAKRKRIHKFRDAARVRLYENYKAINYDRDKLSSRGAIIEREPR